MRLNVKVGEEIERNHLAAVDDNAGVGVKVLEVPLPVMVPVRGLRDDLNHGNNGVEEDVLVDPHGAAVHKSRAQFVAAQAAAGRGAGSAGFPLGLCLVLQADGQAPLAARSPQHELVKGVQAVRLVAGTHGLHIHCLVMVHQRQPALDGVNGDHPQNAHAVVLQGRHVVHEVHVQIVQRQGHRHTNKYARYGKGESEAAGVLLGQNVQNIAR